MEPRLWHDLTDDPDHYVKSFKIFRARCSEFSVFPGWVDGVLGEAVVGKLTLDGQEEVRVLGVGSGSGEMDSPVLNMLSKRFPRINKCVVEPNPRFLDQYKARAQSEVHELQGLYYEWRQQTIQQYEKAGDSAKFHFISAIHSIYYVDESSLMYLYDRLEPGGIMLVVLRSDKSGHARFWNRLQSFRHRFVYTDAALVRNVLDSRGIPYTHFHEPQFLDITKCFDEASEEGSLLVDFLTQTVHFKETAPEDVQRSMMEYLASSDCSESKSEAILLNIDLDAIVISKP
ncbi:histamine N-methyltransferase-like [Patiria miniata]|uniref:Histamine N-methyltransferase n=1 Tax=Patiria miniata TaxID=46514 RepID=A0A914ASZ5_PATMI|nr:histamine N-methyltransferase-like [Patiria miniata]